MYQLQSKNIEFKYKIIYMQMFKIQNSYKTLLTFHYWTHMQKYICLNYRKETDDFHLIKQTSHIMQNNITPLYQISNRKYQFERKKGNKYVSHENDNSYILTIYQTPECHVLYFLFIKSSLQICLWKTYYKIRHFLKM